MAEQEQDKIVQKKGVVVTRTGANGRPTQIRMEDGELREKCQHCGKWISSEKALDAEAGHHCLYLRETLGMSDEALSELRSGKTVDTVPVTEDGRSWIKTAYLHKVVQKAGLPISAMVRAWGGDRGIDPPVDPMFAYVYCGKARWVHPDCASERGLKLIAGVARTPTATAKALKADPLEIPADAPVTKKNRRSVKGDAAEIAAALKS